MPDTIPPLDAQPEEAAAGLSHVQAPEPAARQAGGRAGELFRIAEARRAAFSRIGHRVERVQAVRRQGKLHPAVRVAGAGVDIHFGEVDNPYFQRGYRETADNPRRIQVAWNARESPLVRLRTKGTIDERQAAAGHMFRALFERVQGGMASPSFIQERVDGGAMPDVFTESRAGAARQLKGAAEEIGLAAYTVAQAVCGEGLSLNELARRIRVRPSTAKAALLAALDALAEHWGLGKPRRDG